MLVRHRDQPWNNLSKAGVVKWAHLRSQWSEPGKASWCSVTDTHMQAALFIPTAASNFLLYCNNVFSPSAYCESTRSGLPAVGSASQNTSCGCETLARLNYHLIIYLCCTLDLFYFWKFLTYLLLTNSQQKFKEKPVYRFTRELSKQLIKVNADADYDLNS